MNQLLIHLRAAEEKENGFCRYILTNKVTLWAASYSPRYIVKSILKSIVIPAICLALSGAINSRIAELHRL